MMKRIELTLPVVPRGKSRPRFTVRGGKAITYTDSKTLSLEAEIRTLILKQVGDFKFPGDVPLKLEATFYLPRPKSAPSKRLHPTGKPDGDNLIKALTDSCEHYLYERDSQLTSVTYRKRYGDPPRIEFSLEPETG